MFRELIELGVVEIDIEPLDIEYRVEDPIEKHSDDI